MKLSGFPINPLGFLKNPRHLVQSSTSFVEFCTKPRGLIGNPESFVFPYESMHVSHDRPCSIDLSDSADIITVDRSHIGMINLKISAQTDKLFWRYSHRKYGLSVPFRMLHRKTAISKFAFSQQ